MVNNFFDGLAYPSQERIPAHNNFWLPVKALSKLLRAKLRDALRKYAGFEKLLASVGQPDWVVHCKPVGGGGSALKYLTSYVFRVAISNSRILQFSDGMVTFCYQASATGKRKTCTWSALAFKLVSGSMFYQKALFHGAA